MIISPSVLSADFLHLHQEVKSIEATQAQWLHYDVMDGHFVPNLSFGMDILKSLRQATSLFLDVHLMISEPARYLQAFLDAGADLVTFHYEAVAEDEIAHLCDIIHQHGKKAGLSIKPATPVEVVLPYLEKLDLVLVMSVEPGFGGQRFMPLSLDKIRSLKVAIQQGAYQCLVEVDGGINDQTAIEAKESGADVLVAGSYVFHASDRQAAVASLL
ncbi:MAG TPA: ribulose-phosphate 3-epimerase [Candidatus Fimiplasma intestinipullorum]|uniref:Ribulose-phosphate 3-epimerase n=1 Tax=Candidatus Fimiplasma intestinipullorum TaxID=2840825 RepID=A0A9D1HPK6_9FIRM|nr:ribulose-phosphate 3-epimerase [Candidatus Fimiplasma intestinipullorum]